MEAVILGPVENGHRRVLGRIEFNPPAIPQPQSRMPRRELAGRNRALVLDRLVEGRSWAQLAQHFDISISNARRIVKKWGEKYAPMSVSRETSIPNTSAMHD